MSTDENEFKEDENQGHCCHGEGHDHCCHGHHDTDDADHKECGCPHSDHDRPEELRLPKDVPLPAPSLLSVVSSIATQAMVSMGIFPHPLTGKSEFHFYQAQHLIDTVELLFEKTKGNRTDDESEKLEKTLHELRMLFVAAQNEKDRRENGAKSGE